MFGAGVLVYEEAIVQSKGKILSTASSWLASGGHMAGRPYCGEIISSFIFTIF